MSAAQNPQVQLLFTKSAEDEATLAFAVPDAIFEFHVQQAIEKQLKALIAAHGSQFPYIHDLQVLSDQLEELGEVLPMFAVPLPAFSKYGVVVRYEAVIPLSDEDRETYREVVRDVRLFVAARVAVLLYSS